MNKVCRNCAHYCVYCEICHVKLDYSKYNDTCDEFEPEEGDNKDE